MGRAARRYRNKTWCVLYACACGGGSEMGWLDDRRGGGAVSWKLENGSVEPQNGGKKESRDEGNECKNDVGRSVVPARLEMMK